MLTFISGTPGAGKSLYAVWNFARPVPGSTVESNGVAVPRRLLSNVKDLLIDHDKIDADWMNEWHKHVRPGDVIVFDEVQEIWRNRALGSKVPDCVAALETHRHMGVDIILISQHPMLMDQNVRRLVNQHLHLRRLAQKCAMVYEWDHCSDPGKVKTALQSKLFFHPRKAYSLYKSAQLHTKATARLPRVAVFGVLALAGAAYAVPTVVSRFTERLTGPTPAATAKAPPAVPAAPPKQEPERLAGLPAAPGSAPSPLPLPPRARLLGCIASADKCVCFGEDGQLAQVEPAHCRDSSERVTALLDPMGHRPMVGMSAGTAGINVAPFRAPAVTPPPAETQAPASPARALSLSEKPS